MVNRLSSLDRIVFSLCMCVMYSVMYSVSESCSGVSITLADVWPVLSMMCAHLNSCIVGIYETHSDFILKREKENLCLCVFRAESAICAQKCSYLCQANHSVHICLYTMHQCQELM